MTENSIFDDDLHDADLSQIDVGIVKQEEEENSTKSKLTLYQKARAEKNRLKAMQLRQARLMTKNPYPAQEKKKTFNLNIVGEERNSKKDKKVVDSGAGFFIEEDEEDQEQDNRKLVELPAPIIEPDRPECLECREDLAESYLLRTFDFSVCDKCRDTEKDGKHELITKTEAKNTFLLKDYDLDKKEPILKFVVRKNPHNPRWGDMKLYLRSQVEERALEIWESEEKLEAEHEKRESRKEQVKVKRFNKRIKDLRMQVRGSLYKKDLSTHQHEFGDEGYDEESDEYFKTCQTCDFTQRYEKM